MSDDHAANAISAYGGRLSEFFKTPNVDRLANESDQFSGAEIEQAILSAMYRAFAENREFTTEDVLQSIQETVPLAVTASEKITHLRQWAHKRART